MAPSLPCRPGGGSSGRGPIPTLPSRRGVLRPWPHPYPAVQEGGPQAVAPSPPCPPGGGSSGRGPIPTLPSRRGGPQATPSNPFPEPDFNPPQPKIHGGKCKPQDTVRRKVTSSRGPHTPSEGAGPPSPRQLSKQTAAGEAGCPGAGTRLCPPASSGPQLAPYSFHQTKHFEINCL